MTLQKLIKKCFYKPVFNNIYKHYLKEDVYYTANKVSQMDINFLQAWNELSNTIPAESEDKDVKDSVIFIGNRVEDEEVFTEVCLLNKVNNETYGLDFLDWNVLLAKEIKTDFELADSEILAHILWELTFWGFSSEAVKQVSDNMLSELEEIDFE